MNGMRILLVIVFCQIWAQSIYGTAQIPDVLYWNNDTVDLFANPLEAFYNEINERPKNFFGDKVGCGSTACWRGYVGYWELIKDTLFLIDIKSCCFEEDSLKASLSDLFGEKHINGRVKADWLNGEIIFPKGRLIFYEHMGYNSIYEFETELTFDAGTLIEIKEYDNSKSFESEYAKDPEKLRDFIYTNIEWDKFPSQILESMQFVVNVRTDSLGGISETKIMYSNNESYNNEIENVVKKIPALTVIYSRGKIYQVGWNIPITINENIRGKYSR